MKALRLSLLLLSLAAPSCRSAAPDSVRASQPAGNDPAAGEDPRSYYKGLNDPSRGRDGFTDTDLIYY
ncbi:hypothetical protein [Luteolibacter sp. Populi]|uniref:hypothetical protein n=1 Tax=Luteolibacter sp. Populi TaxID=3230487 RepID=UPI0034654027